MKGDFNPTGKILATTFTALIFMEKILLFMASVISLDTVTGIWMPWGFCMA